MVKRRLAVFISGRGSNMQALMEYAKRPLCAYEVCVVISDNPRAVGLERAQKAGIEAFPMVKGSGEMRPQYEARIVAALQSRSVDVIALAGFMRIVGDTILDAFAGRILNIHPSLLPSFKGLDAQAQALEYGVRYTGCTVHLVDKGMDTGPILDQRVIAVDPSMDAEQLSVAILHEEHELYGPCVDAFCKSEFRVTGRITARAQKLAAPEHSTAFMALHYGDQWEAAARSFKGRNAIAVSACLLGVPCRYDGAAKPHGEILQIIGETPVMPICPEVASGMWVPRIPMEFSHGDGNSCLSAEGRLEDRRGNDLTRVLITGSERLLSLVTLGEISHVVLKARSPSCGKRQVHRKGELVKGQGIFCALAEKHGITVFSEEDTAELKKTMAGE
ncbi:phosphoribosylglycinamide formyltransferase [Myxococcota bacterium]|nr:phosphoribosylglycinamide formyltransferase [Myxococcota bacterium]MBU1534947.1 phosphoribosylglycinamide formyltransferase [Myxococcota bacterium]